VTHAVCVLLSWLISARCFSLAGAFVDSFAHRYRGSRVRVLRRRFDCLRMPPLRLPPLRLPPASLPPLHCRRFIADGPADMRGAHEPIPIVILTMNANRE